MVEKPRPRVSMRPKRPKPEVCMDPAEVGGDTTVVLRVRPASDEDDDTAMARRARPCHFEVYSLRFNGVNPFERASIAAQGVGEAVRLVSGAAASVAPAFGEPLQTSIQAPTPHDAEVRVRRYLEGLASEVQSLGVATDMDTLHYTGVPSRETFAARVEQTVESTIRVAAGPRGVPRAALGLAAAIMCSSGVPDRVSEDFTRRRAVIHEIELILVAGEAYLCIVCESDLPNRSVRIYDGAGAAVATRRAPNGTATTAVALSILSSLLS